MNEKWSSLLLIVIMVTMTTTIIRTTQAEPFGANVSVLSSSRRNVSTTGQVEAVAGNVTELNINAASVTKHWQGYYGNVSGNIQLGDSNGYNLYSWQSASPRGEIFASRSNSLINWTGVGCANSAQIINEDAFVGAHPGQSVDSVNKTFNYTGHPAFSIGARGISGCRSVSVFGSGEGNVFWESILIDNGTDLAGSSDDILLYTGLIDPDRIGFNGNTYDFQMLVGENGNGSQEFPGGTTTTYYFYVELD